MKAMFSEEYYKANWDKFLSPVPGDDFIDLEGSLKKTMQKYIDNGMPEIAIPVVEKMEAQKLIDKMTDLVHKEMETLKRVLNGEASFGMMTQAQEITARANYHKRFEFNCLQLREFKAKHSV